MQHLVNLVHHVRALGVGQLDAVHRRCELDHVVGQLPYGDLRRVPVGDVGEHVRPHAPVLLVRLPRRAVREQELLRFVQPRVPVERLEAVERALPGHLEVGVVEPPEVALGDVPGEDRVLVALGQAYDDSVHGRERPVVLASLVLKRQGERGAAIDVQVYLEAGDVVGEVVRAHGAVRLAHRHLGLDHRRVGEYGRHGRSPGLHG